MSALASLPRPVAIHATAVLVGETAVILRGVSGSGKSALALALIAAATARGIFARLVADDRLFVSEAGGRVIVAPHPAIAGRIERRFVGIDAVPHKDEAVAGLVVDLEAPGPGMPDRLPDGRDGFAVVAGMRLPRLVLPGGHAWAVDTILDRLSRS